MFYIQFIIVVSQSNTDTMGSQVTKEQQNDEEFSNHSSINFITENTEASSIKKDERSIEETNLLGGRNSFADESKVIELFPSVIYG